MLGTVINTQVEALAGLAIFAELDEHGLRDVLRIAELTVADTGTTVLEQGAQDLAFAVVVEGAVDVLRDGITIGRLRRGDTFGEHSIYANLGHPATLRASEPAMVLVADLVGFARIVARYPSVAGWLRPSRIAGWTITG